MNLQEYTISLQQQKNPKLEQDEIIAKVEEWKKNNSQPEVEEETIEVDTKDETNDEVKDDPYSIRSSSKILSNEPVNLSSTTQQTGMSLGELNASLEPEETKREEEKETWDALTVVAKPNETHEANGWEFQYEFDEVGKPIYRRRKKGVDTWETLDPEAGGDQQDAYYAVSGVFGHTTIDGGLMMSQNQVISNASKKSQSLTNELVLESKTITDDASVVDPKFAEVATIFEEQIKLTPEENEGIVLYEDNVPVSGQAVDWWNDQEIDETKQEQYIDPYSKTGNVRTRTVKTGNKIPNPDWVEARDAAIAEIANQEGKSPEQLDLDSPEMQERIKNKMISTKAIALKDELELDKLEDFIENEPSGFTWKKLAMWIGGGPVGQHLDAKDVWSRSEKQQMMGLYKKDQLSKLTTQQKGIGSFIDKSANTLEMLSASAEAIANQEYQTPNQIVKANKALQQINNQKNQIFDLIKSKYDELDKTLEDSKDASAAINDLERNYSVIPIMIHNAENSAIDMGQGIETLAFKIANLPNDIGLEIDKNLSKKAYDKTHGDGAWDKLSPEDKKKNTKSNVGSKIGETYSAFNPFWQFGGKYALEAWSDSREEAHAALDKYQVGLMNGVAESMTMDELKDASDWGRYIFATAGAIAPQMGVIVATGGYGVGIVTAQAGGSRFLQYENEMKQNAKERELHEKNKPVKRENETDEAFKFRLGEWEKSRPAAIDYNLAQMWGGAMVSMGAEYIGGRYIDLPMLNRAKAFKGFGVKVGFTREFGKKFLASTYGYAGDLIKEGGEEVFAEAAGNLYDRTILGKDVNVFDGWKDNFFSGLMMANGFKTPALFNVFTGAVQTPGDQINIKNSQNLIKNKINTILENPEMSLETKKLLNDDIASETLKINNTITTANNRYNNMPRETIDQLGKNEQDTFKVNKQIEAVTNDKGIKVGKEQLLEDLNNKKNELTGQKNKILEPYVSKDDDAKVVDNGELVAPTARQLQEGSDVVAEQLGDTGIARFDNTQDYLSGMETLKAQGVDIRLAEDADGNILPAEQQSYGTIATFPDGTKQVIINNASSEADGVLPADKHEVLHAFATKIDPDKMSKWGEDLYNTLVNDSGKTGRVEIDDRTKRTLDAYRKQYNDGVIDKETFYEEVMAVTSDALTANKLDSTKGIKIKETGPLLNILNKFLEGIGWKQSFKDGKQAIDFLESFNKDVESGKGLSQGTLDTAGITEGQGIKIDNTQDNTQPTKDSKAVDTSTKTSKARQADLDKMTPAQRDAEEGYSPWELVRQSDGSLGLDRKFVGKAEARAALKRLGGDTTQDMLKMKVRKSEKPEVSLTPYMGVGNQFKQGETEDGETPAETRKKSEKNFMDFHKSHYDRDSETALAFQDGPGPLDGIVALDKQLAKIVRDSGAQSVYSWFWQDVASQPEEHNRRTKIYRKIEERKNRVKALDTNYGVDEIRAMYKKAKSAKNVNPEAVEDIKLAIQEKFKNFPTAVIDSGIDIYTGKQKGAKQKPSVKYSQKIKETPLEAINNLIPESVKTKDQFDAFIRDNKSAKAIADALLPGGVINNYIRSKETSREQGGKMIDEMYERIFNFNPEAKRADGTPVGPKGFGEAIFANTRFAKMVANKALAEKSERQKQEKRIDSKEAKEVADTTKETEVKDDKLAKKPSETTTLDKTTENKITKAIKDAYKDKDIKFSDTRNIPQEVADIYAAEFGINPETIVNKKRNFQKTDAEGLTKAKQYLLKNATNDFARLPRTKDDFGKGTFIPKNVKDALYTNDKLTGNLKDYMDLVRKKPVKPIYRDRVGQTIRGLLGLHIRNRIIETAQPLQGKRQQQGVKFSEKIPAKKVNEIIDEGNIEGIKSIASLIDNNNFDNLPTDQKIEIYKELFKVLAEKGFSRGGLFKSGNLTSAGLKLSRLLGQQKNTGLHFVESIEALDEKIYDAQLILDNTPGAVTIQLGDGKTVYSREKLEDNIKQYKATKKAIEKGEVGLVSDLRKSIPDNKKTANKNIEIAIKPNRKSINSKVAKKSVQDNIANIDEIKQGIRDVLDAAYDLPKHLQVPFLRMFHADSMYNNNIGRQIGALLGDMGIFPIGPDGKPLPITNEHAFQFGLYTKVIGVALNLPRLDPNNLDVPNFDVVRDWLSNRIFQVALADIPGIKNQESNFPEGTKGVFDPTESKEAWNAKSEGEPFLIDTLKDYINGKISAKDLNKVSVLTRYFNEYFYRNPNNVRVYNPKTGKLETVAKIAGSEIIGDVFVNGKKYTAKELMSVDRYGIAKFPNVEKYQAFATMKYLRGEWSKADVRKFLDLTTPLAVKKDVAGEKITGYASEILKPGLTIQQIKDILENSFETKVKAMESVRVPKEKGISVFDFDDTLAKTKEKVIVINQDGSIKEISASQFAKDAAKLKEQGAEFDFKNFENVSLDTAEGPLADLARKRQGKFGSKDIFVLTARPQVAAESIKQFLDAIGINIPLQNITGLEDGTPQAKVDWVLNKTAEGYNDFYFADDSFANVAGVKAVLDAVDVKNKVHQARVQNSLKLDKELNEILEEVTGIDKFKRYSDVRARLVGAKKDGGLTKRVANQFTITPSADDFIGLTYAFRGEGEQGNRHTQWIEDNLIKPYNKAELELMSAKITVADDFAELRKQFPSLKTKRNKLGVLQNPLHAGIGIGPFTKSQAIRVYMWNKQGMDIPGMSKRDINALVKAIESDMELQVFADEVIQIQKGKFYPAPGKSWLAGDIKSDILNGLDKGFRKKLMTEFSENADIIFSPENLNKLEALFGSKYREALIDSLRRMKTGSNRPQYDGPGSRIVNDMLDWLNASVGVTMFLNRKSGLLQMLSTVNFINWGDNNLYAASKAFASKDFYPTFMRLMNSPYLVNRRDGLKINVNEAELVDRGRRDGFQGLVSYLLDKGFIFTRIADSLAIATGGATFFINRKKALLNRVNPETGKKYTEAEADTKAFDDFYAIAEETQQSSNPSRISQQQASMAGRVFLSFQNVTMQFNRKTKKSILDFVKRRKRPGMTQRESDMSNLSNVVYYVGMQNLIFHSLQQALFAGLFGEEEEDEKEKNKTFDTANSMVDSLLFGLGFGGAIVSTVKNVAMKIFDESQTKSPDYEHPLWDLFDVSPVIDSKVRKLRQAARSFSWNMKEIKRRGWSLDNPAYLAVSQIISSFFNVPVDNLMNMMNAGSNIMDNEVRMWQKIALSLGWSPYILGLPYWGRQSTIDREAKEDEQLKIDYAKAVKNVKAKGFTKKIPLSGPNHYIPKGELGVDYMQVERIDGTIQYYVKHKK